MLKIGSVWRYEKEDETVYFKGRIDLPCPVVLGPGISILLFKNKSDHEKSPALDILIAEDKPKPQPQSKNESNSDVDF